MLFWDDMIELEGVSVTQTVIVLFSLPFSWFFALLKSYTITGISIALLSTAIVTL